MALIGSTSEERQYRFLLAEIGNKYGAAGLAGNIKAESNHQANNLQNSYNTKLGMTDEQYTAAVDNGTYTNFVHDSAGYGLVQWTYWSLKQYLLDFWNSYGGSIGDEEMQLRCLVKQLKEGYKAVWNVLVSAKSVREASDAVLLKFERPADQSVSAQERRAGYGQAILNKYDNVQVDTSNTSASASDYIGTMRGWLGKNEADGSHKEIIDLYNSFLPHPRGYAVKYTDAWCATTTSAAGIANKLTDIIPIECSVAQCIELAKKMGIWIENDAEIPMFGDLVCYDWQDTGVGDNTGYPDHIGAVDYVNVEAGYFTVIEGNYSDSVKKRTVMINGRYIRGFIRPKYTSIGSTTFPQDSKKDIATVAREVISGVWGNQPYRQQNLEAAGYVYAEVQAKVMDILNGGAAQPSTPVQDQSQAVKKQVTAGAYAQNKDTGLAGKYKTTANLYMRDGAGTNKKALVLIPNGTVVSNYGFYSMANGVKWLYIQVTIDGVQYTGFSSSAYLKKC